MSRPAFDSVTFNAHGGLMEVGTLAAISEETARLTTGILQGSADYAKEYGGSFVRQCVEAVERQSPRYPLIVDSKVHMLKPGWWPGIPGWHVDFAPGYLDVVQWDAVDADELHYMAISSDVSATEYLAHSLTLQVPRVPRINGFLSKAVELYRPVVTMESAQPNRLYRFDQLALHRVTPATREGWRIFVRISATLLRKPLNHLRTQASQVYILSENMNDGW